MKDFFVSYNGQDKEWAEWIAWQLEAAGYSTVIQAWDFRPGGNFVLDMQRAAEDAARTIAVLSQNYLDAMYTQPEWAAAFAQDPTGLRKTLLPVRVQECNLKGMLSQIVYIDLVGKPEDEARELLLAGLQPGRAKPSAAPGFPQGQSGAAPPRPQEPPPTFPVAGAWGEQFLPPAEREIILNVQAGGEFVGRDKTEIHNHYYADSHTQPVEEIPPQPFEPEMILIQAGPFVMGEAETGAWAKHEVTLPAYEISKYPITNKDYLTYVEQAGVAVSPKTGWELARIGQRPPADRLDYPMVGLSWDEAAAYCRWLQQETGRAYRLPTEAEWEKAARGPDDARAYPWGDAFDSGRCNAGTDVAPVSRFPPQSPYGVCDLVGNVWEWTLTMWGRDKDEPRFTYPYPPPAQPDGRHDPPDPGATFREYRICRGGSFKDKPERLRCSSRARILADSQYARRGFRVARGT